jgi:putative hydrolase of the HAD superfamily
MTIALARGSADALLFDLGRVVLEIDFHRTLAVWAGHAGCALSDLQGRLGQDENYQRHERGEIDDAHFFANLGRTLGIGLSDAQWLEGWNAIFVGEMPGIAPLLRRASQTLPLYAFSNTNAAHAAHFAVRHAELLGLFKNIFLSSTIGMRKPNAEAYDHVIDAIGVSAQRIVFFDDLIENIEGARGLQAVHVSSSDDVARAMAKLGL